MRKRCAIALMMALGLAISCAKTATYDPSDGAQTKIKETEDADPQDHEAAQDEDKYKE